MWAMLIASCDKARIASWLNCEEERDSDDKEGCHIAPRQSTLKTTARSDIGHSLPPYATDQNSSSNNFCGIILCLDHTVCKLESTIEQDSQATGALVIYKSLVKMQDYDGQGLHRSTSDFAMFTGGKQAFNFRRRASDSSYGPCAMRNSSIGNKETELGPGLSGPDGAL